MENTSLHGTENYSDLLRASCRWDHAYGFAVRVADFYQRHVSKLKRCVFPKESRDSSLLKSSATRTICTTRTVSVLWARSLFTRKRNVNRLGAFGCSFIHHYFHALNTWEQDGTIMNNIINTAPTIAIYGEQGPDFDSARQV